MTFEDNEKIKEVFFHYEDASFVDKPAEENQLI